MRSWSVGACRGGATKWSSPPRCRRRVGDGPNDGGPGRRRPDPAPHRRPVRAEPAPAGHRLRRRLLRPPPRSDDAPRPDPARLRRPGPPGQGALSGALQLPRLGADPRPVARRPPGPQPAGGDGDALQPRRPPGGAGSRPRLPRPRRRHHRLQRPRRGPAHRALHPGRGAEPGRIRGGRPYATGPGTASRRPGWAAPGWSTWAPSGATPRRTSPWPGSAPGRRWPAAIVGPETNPSWTPCCRPPTSPSARQLAAAGRPRPDRRIPQGVWGPPPEQTLSRPVRGPQPGGA